MSFTSNPYTRKDFVFWGFKNLRTSLLLRDPEQHNMLFLLCIHHKFPINLLYSADIRFKYALDSLKRQKVDKRESLKLSM